MQEAHFTLTSRAVRLLGGLVLAAMVSGCGVMAQEPPLSADTGQSQSPAAAAEVEDSAKKELRTASVVVSGDLLWHPSLFNGAQIEAQNTADDGYDFAPLFADLKPVVEAADLAICHEEVPFAPAGEEPSGYPSFGAPDAVAAGVKAVGWDMCTTASNHSLDRGMAGLHHTVNTFNSEGVDVVGTYVDQTAAKKPYIYTTDQGVKISVVIGTYGLNGLSTPPGEEYAVDMLKPEAMIAKAQAAKEAGADIVLAAIHGGDEYETMPNQQQVDAATALAHSDAVDLIYGHHVHVVQPWDRINGKLVIYGLGNMIAQHQTDVPRGYEGVTAQLQFKEREDGSFTLDEAAYFPTLISRNGISSDSDGTPSRLFQVNKAIKDDTVFADVNAERLQLAKQRTAEAVNALDITDIVEK